jgi:hypothetical protein
MKTYEQRYKELEIELAEEGITNGDMPSDDVAMEVESALTEDDDWDGIWPTK